MEATLKDPVCGMQVSRDSHALEHLGIHYAFCSLQCRERFLGNPHLYVGYPGQPAPAQQGVEVVKQRRFRIEPALSDADAAAFVEAMGALMGILGTEVAGDTITIRYDLMQVSAQQIEARIGEIGLKLGEGWSERLRRGFVHELEACELDSLEAVPPAGRS